VSFFSETGITRNSTNVNTIPYIPNPVCLIRKKVRMVREVNWFWQMVTPIALSQTYDRIP